MRNLFRNSVSFFVTLLTVFMAANAFAAITVKDYVNPFIIDVKSLKGGDVDHYKSTILRYEFLNEELLNKIYYIGMTRADRESDLKNLDNYAKNLPTLVETYSKKIPEIVAIANETDKRIQKEFGINLHTSLYFFTALSDSDAITLQLDSEKNPVVALNLRQVVAYPTQELKILLAHELFHVVQSKIQHNQPEPELVDRMLFMEGWATYASSVIYPGLPDWKYISYFRKDDEEFKKFELERKHIISSIIHDWHSTDGRVADKYFSANAKLALPFEPRSGYYLGYLAAKAMSTKSHPKRIAMMKYTDFRKQILPELQALSQS